MDTVRSFPLAVALVGFVAIPGCKGRDQPAPAPATSASQAAASVSDPTTPFQDHLEALTERVRLAQEKVEKLRAENAPRPMYRRLKPSTELPPNASAGLLPVYNLALHDVAPDALTSQAALQIVGLLEPPGASRENGYEDVPGPFPEELALMGAVHHYRVAEGKFVSPEETLLLTAAFRDAQRHAVSADVRKRIAHLAELGTTSRNHTVVEPASPGMVALAFNEDEGWERDGSTSHGPPDIRLETPDHHPAEPRGGPGPSFGDNRGQGGGSGTPEGRFNREGDGGERHQPQPAVAPGPTGPSGNSARPPTIEHPGAFPMDDYVQKLLVNNGPVPVPPDKTLDQATADVKSAADLVLQAEAAGAPRPEIKVPHPETTEPEIEKPLEDLRDMLQDIAKAMLDGKKVTEALESGTAMLLIDALKPSVTGTGDQFDIIAAPRPEEIQLYKALSIYEQLYDKKHTDDRYRQMLLQYLAYRNGAGLTSPNLR